MFFRAFSTNKTTVLIGQSEGLPNITGRLTRYDPQAGENNYSSGALYDLKSYFGSVFSHESFPYNYSAGFEFDASRSNPIYGNNAHVTPKNATIKIWQRIS